MGGKVGEWHMEVEEEMRKQAGKDLLDFSEDVRVEEFTGTRVVDFVFV